MLAQKQRDPASTVGVKEELDFIGAQFDGYLTAISAANKQLGASVQVGAMVIDSEFFVWEVSPNA